MTAVTSVEPDAPQVPDQPESPPDAAERTPSAGPPPRRPHPPAAVWLATALFGLVLALWSVVVPHYRAPDEHAHVDLALYLAEGNSYPRYDGRYIGEAMQLDTQRWQIDSMQRWPAFDARDAPPRSNRPDVDDLGGLAPDRQAEPTNHPRPDSPRVFNQMPQHPPLYYLGMAAVLGAERLLLPGDGVPSLDREVGLLRLVNVALVLPLPLLAWATARRLGAGDRAAAVAALGPLALPQLAHIGASVNNDNLLTLLGGILAVLVVGVARGRRTWRTDLAVGVVLGLALLTKAFALMYVPWIVVAYGLAWWTAGRRRPALRGLALAGVTSAVVGAWWWMANLVRYGQFAPTTENLTRSASDRPEGFVADPLAFSWTFVGRLVSRTWAWVGYRNPKFDLPAALVVLCTAGVIAASVVAWRSATRGRSTAGGVRRWDVTFAWLLTALLWVFIARRAYGLYAVTGHHAFIQGRYLYSAIVPPMAVVAVGLTVALRRWAAPVALAVVLLVQAWMLSDIVRGAWSGPGPWGSVKGVLAWSPWPAALVVAVAVLAVVTAAATAVALRPTAAAGPAPP
ncbi:MAG TPA: phospholipid carrier-dependent glycosyltransferase [Acidimicrobiales bacterium]|nr:phospholipid carrier-dependent glycosyltransferase [Acidimicrobiales bacterium]